MDAGPKGFSKLKNVTLHHVLTRSGDDTWVLIHEDGWRDPYFDYYATHLIKTKQNSLNTREQYCRCVANFVDYLVEAARWYRESGRDHFKSPEHGVSGGRGAAGFSGAVLVELIEIYTKVLAGGAHSGDPVVIELSRRLKRKVSAHQSQRVHIAAINSYLHLSEAFNVRMQQSGLAEINGLPVLPEGALFPDFDTATEYSHFERIAMSTRTMIGGVVAGGAKLKRIAVLKVDTDSDDDEDKFDYDSAFPLECAPALITSGFCSYRDRALYCLLMASGIRISEALTLTWDDVDCLNRKVYIRDPRKKDLEKVYLGFLSLEQRRSLPYKGRTHPVTLLIEPFASEFWRLLHLYMKEEMFTTSAHPFIFQVLKGENLSHPLIFSDQSNLRKAFKDACRKIDPDFCYGAHSLRHMYGVYCLNYWPKENGSYGLTPDEVQFLMGHSHRDSTMLYAKPDTLILEVEQKVNASILSGFGVEDRATTRVKVLEQKLREAREEARKVMMLPRKEERAA